MKVVRNFAVVGALFTLVVGTLLHFVYEWKPNTLTALFGAVNESTWEHLKLLFWPTLVFGIAEYFLYGRELDNFVPTKVVSILLGMTAIVVLFYTYTGIWGTHVMWMDIAIFVIAVLISYSYTAWQLQKLHPTPSSIQVVVALLLLLALLLVFVFFTYTPPHIPLFADPTTGSYGVSA